MHSRILYHNRFIPSNYTYPHLFQKKYICVKSFILYNYKGFSKFTQDFAPFVQEKKTADSSALLKMEHYKAFWSFFIIQQYFKNNEGLIATVHNFRTKYDRNSYLTSSSVKS